MIAVTCRNGEHFAVDPLHIERVETGSDTVIHLVDGTKYVVDQTFDELLRTISDHRATVLVSQAIGAGQQERANRLARQAIVWGVLVGIPVSLGMFVAAPTLIGLFGAAPDVTAAATTYLRVTAATSIALFLSFVCGAVLRGAGDSRTPLKAAILRRRRVLAHQAWP